MRVIPFTLACLALAGCAIIDVKPQRDGHGIASDAFISGYATAGWPEDDSYLKLGLFDGRSDGAIFMFNLWKLVRVELGLVGASVGVGPLDFGLGLFFYNPRPPTYMPWRGDPGDGASQHDSAGHEALEHDTHEHDTEG